MSATTLTAPVAVSTPNPNRLRYVLAAVAIAALFILSFAIGRWTSSSPSSQPAVTTTPATVPVAPGVNVPCSVGHPC